jgi:sn-glycerol 3-phosphate transport system substrate-binding protein
MHTMSSSVRRVLAAALPLTALIVTAGVTGATPVAGAASKALPTCPLSALRSAKGTVDITMWESATQANATTLTALTTAFNNSQKKIHVKLVQQATYTTTWLLYQSGLSDHQLPNIAYLTETGLQGVVDTQTVLPAQSCINATHYNTSDFVPRTLSWYKIGGVQEGMPFAVSIPVVYYNKKSFTAAGINPTKPPTTLAQFLADAKVLKAHGIGTGLEVDPWHFRNWLATENAAFLNNNNGRTTRSTQAAFDSKAGLAVFKDLDTLTKTYGAVTNPDTGSDAIDNLLGIGNGKYGMTIDTSAALGTITSVAANYPNVTIGVGPLPVATAKVKGGVSGGGAALYICDKQPAAEQAASWEFEMYLDSASSQATWAKGTGYIPIRTSSARSAAITSLWASDPNFKVAYSQLISGPVTNATEGPVDGPYLTVNKAIVTAEDSMYQHGASPSAALKTASRQVDSILSTYNGRIGAG